MGADVGKYSPQFSVVDPMPKAPKFAGRFTFTPMHDFQQAHDHKIQFHGVTRTE